MQQRIGGFTVVREVGRGATGAVFEVRAPDRPDRLALKLLLEARGGLAPRFLREAAVLEFPGRHPAIVSVVASGQEGGLPYLVMPLAEGGSLEERIKSGDLRGRPGARLLVDVARAAHFAHEAGVLHRDLKPANVLLDGLGRPYLADFGLARDQLGAERLTATGALLGTPEYRRRSSSTAAPRSTGGTDGWRRSRKTS